MPIQIIDNFDLNSPQPIDNRFVVGSQSFYKTKDDIPYKYKGMRVWDLNIGSAGQAYVWNGTNFVSENTVGVSSTATTFFIPMMDGTTSNVLSTSLKNSILRQLSGRLAINSTSFDTAYTVTVNGGISAIGVMGFKGRGTELTNLNASNITSGNMSVSKLQLGTGILTSPISNAGLPNASYQNGSVSFKPYNQVRVGFADKLSNTSLSIFGVSFDGSTSVSGPLSGATTINFGDTATSKVTLKYSGLNGRTLNVPSLINTTSTLVVAEQTNLFTGTQSFSNVVSINKSAKSLELTSSNYTYLSYGLNGQEVAYVGTTGSNFDITNKNIGGIVFKANTGTLTSPALVQRMSVRPTGFEISSNASGTPMKKVVFGTIRIYQNGSQAVVVRGSGFTVSPLSSGSTPVVTVTISNQIADSGTDFAVICSMDGSVNYYKWVCVSEKTSSNSFKIVVAYDDGSSSSWPDSWTGTVDVSFVCLYV
jgi:hypothetical protein